MDKKKKILIIIAFLLFTITIILIYALLQKYILKTNFEKNILSFAYKNDKTVFQINKIVLFSNCDAKNKTGSVTNFTIENLYQYTDMAIFINNPSQDEKNLENTLKKVTIRNIQYTNLPHTRRTKFIFQRTKSICKK